MVSERNKNYGFQLTKARILTKQTGRPAYVFRNEEEGVYFVSGCQDIRLAPEWELVKEVLPGD